MSYLQTLLAIIKHPRYLLLSAGVAAIILLLAIWISSYQLIVFTFFTPQFSFITRVSILWSSLELFQTNFTILTRLITLAIALLAGIHSALILFYLRHRSFSGRTLPAGLFGAVLGFLSIGCATCGSILLSSFFGISATAGFLALLPFHGQEFSLLGIVILLLSIASILKKIHEPTVCKL